MFDHHCYFNFWGDLHPFLFLFASELLVSRLYWLLYVFTLKRLWPIIYTDSLSFLIFPCCSLSIICDFLPQVLVTSLSLSYVFSYDWFCRLSCGRRNVRLQQLLSLSLQYVSFSLCWPSQKSQFFSQSAFLRSPRHFYSISAVLSSGRSPFFFRSPAIFFPDFSLLFQVHWQNWYSYHLYVSQFFSLAFWRGSGIW